MLGKLVDSIEVRALPNGSHQEAVDGDNIADEAPGYAKDAGRLQPQAERRVGCSARQRPQRLTEQAKENAREEMAASVPLSVMAARVARRRPIMRVAKARLGLRRSLYTGLFRLRLQVLWRQIRSIVRFRVRQGCAR